MKLKVVAIIEQASDGGFGCYIEDDLGDFRVAGYGETAEAARKDLLVAYEFMREVRSEEGKETPELSITYKYDMQSFFDYFSMLNASKVAERAGINPSLLRRYISGKANAGQKQYDKMRKAVREIAAELAEATF